MVTFYTSDHHFGHRNIGVLTGRPWENVDDMNEALIERWNETVGPDDLVFHLGDFSLSMSALRHVERLNGRIVLVAGNHDMCWTGHGNSTKVANAIERYREVFHEVHPSGVLQHQIGDQPVVLSHLPYHGDSGHDERYTHLRPKDEGLPIICGHVHNTWARLYGGDGRAHRGQVNVGVDVWGFAPVSRDRVMEEVARARQAHP